mgnify:CR=1 FL=1
MEDRQRVKLSYTATDVTTGEETVGFEYRLGLMSLEDTKKFETALKGNLPGLFKVFD